MNTPTPAHSANDRDQEVHHIWGRPAWETRTRWYNGIRTIDISETLIETFVETQINKARVFSRRFRKTWIITWIALVAVIFGQALIARALNFDARIATPESWTSLDDIRSAVTESLSQSWKTQLKDLWLFIPGVFFVAFGTLGVIPAIVFLGAWLKEVFYAAASVGIRSWSPWPLLPISFFIPVIQFLLPPLILMSVCENKNSLYFRIWRWWFIFVSTIFTLASGVGSFFGSGPFIVTYLATFAFGILAFICVWLTKGLLESFDRFYSQRFENIKSLPGLPGRLN